MLAIPALIVSLPPVQNWLFNPEPQIEIDLASEIAVVDVRRQMSGLTILLNNNELNSTLESVVASRVVIRNKGGASVKPNDISSEDPIGFQVIGGQILEIAAFHASSQHLRRLANPKRIGNSITVGPNIIIDKSDSMTFDLIIKKPRQSTIQYRSLGKIADSGSIKIVDIRTSGSSENFIEKTFFGNYRVQIARLIAYFLGGIFIVAGFAFLFEKISEINENRKLKRRKEIVDRFLSSSENRNKISDTICSAIYLSLGGLFINKKFKELNLMNVSSGLGKIKNEMTDKERWGIEFDLDSISRELDRHRFSPEYWIENIENSLNLVNEERTDIQQAYIISVGAFLNLLSALDPKNKLNPVHRFPTIDIEEQGELRSHVE